MSTTDPPKPLARETFDRGKPAVLERAVTMSQLMHRLRVWIRDPETGRAGRRHPDDPAVMILSGPGLGKSQMLAQLAAEFGIGFVDVRLNSTPLIELMGLQAVNPATGTTSWKRSDLLPPEDDPRGGIFFLDELTTNIPALQTEGYQILREGRIGPHRLPETWFVVAAGNRMNDKGVYYQMPDPLVNRCRFYELVPDFTDWLTWNMARGYMEREVYAYLRVSPDDLYCRPVDVRGVPFATPRSWTFVLRTIHRWTRQCPHDRLQALHDARVDIEGEIGPAMAAKFYAYLQHFRDIPDVEAIMTGKNAVAPPAGHKPDVVYAILGALVAYVPRTKDLTPFLRYVMKLEPTYAVLGVLDALRHRGDTLARLQASPLWTAFAARHKDVIAGMATTRQEGA